MRTINFILLTCVLLVASHALRAQGTVRVGIFDSRAIAIAYGQSDAFATEMKSLMQDLKKAKDEKDQKRISELEAKGKTQQKLLHLQGFSKGSVSEILAKYTAEVEAVAGEAKVALIVSQYELAYQSGVIETVDVTEALVKKINDSPRVVGMLPELRKNKPLPLIDVLGMKDEH